jgi:dihydroneopterin aldolase
MNQLFEVVSQLRANQSTYQEAQENQQKVLEELAQEVSNLATSNYDALSRISVEESSSSNRTMHMSDSPFTQ